MTEQPERRDVSEIAATYPENVSKVNTWLEQQNLADSHPYTKRTLFAISDDLEHLNDLLDNCDDAQQQQLVNEWLEQLVRSAIASLMRMLP